MSNKRKVPTSGPDSEEEPSPRSEADEISENDNESESDSESVGSVSLSVGSNTEGTEFRRRYTKLITKCRRIEKKEGFTEAMQKEMTKNMESAKFLFDELSQETSERSATVPTSDNNDISTSSPRKVGSNPADYYMAFLHTKMISDVLKVKTSSICASNQFKIPKLLDNLKLKYVDENHSYCSEMAIEELSKECKRVSRTAPYFTAVVGSFDRNMIFVPKEKKPRAPIQRRQIDNFDRSQEEFTNAQTSERGKQPVKTVKKLNRILRQHFKMQNRPTSLYEFILDPSSMNKSIESLFYASFLVRDGWAGISKPAGTSTKDLGILIKPEVPPNKGENAVAREKSIRKNRNQYIVSFTPKMYQELCKVSTGSSIIPSLEDDGDGDSNK